MVSAAMWSAVVLAFCLSVAHAATPATPYVRPHNADCVGASGSATQLSYITPATFYLTGTQSQSQNGYTSVRAFPPPQP